jgi:hypothetical protein
MSRKRQLTRKSGMPREKSLAPPAKTRTWTLRTILGTVLAVLGAMGIVELRPQVTVSPQEPIEKSQPFFVPFRILNSGYLAFHVDHVFGYASKVKAGNISITDGTFHNPDWNNFDLDRGEPKEIIPELIRASNFPSSADITIVVDIRPFRWFPWSSRRYFRFIGAYVDNWQWLAEPSQAIQADADRAIEDHMQKIPQSR